MTTQQTIMIVGTSFSSKGSIPSPIISGAQAPIPIGDVKANFKLDIAIAVSSEPLQMQMAKSTQFRVRVERGLDDLDRGRYKPLKDVKKKLGDV